MRPKVTGRGLKFKMVSRKVKRLKRYIVTKLIGYVGEAESERLGFPLIMLFVLERLFKKHIN